jgi:hypothetical protein
VRRLLAVILLAVLAAVPLAGDAAAKAQVKRQAPVLIGIGDQKLSMFSDPRFKMTLRIRYVRYAIAWDTLEVPAQRRELDAWLWAAKRANVRPLVTFGHSRRPGHHRVLPTVKHFASLFVRFRKRYPWVKDFGTWNEANYCGEPTCHKPGLVAQYWRQARLHCRTGCHVLAAELLDFPNMVSWARAFRRASRMEPKYWGLHNYRDANRLTTANTRSILRATRGQLWLTETGGIVRRRNKSTVKLPESAAHAAIATRWLFDRLVPLSRRITRVYLYEWNATSPRDTWDTALIDPRGRIRPAFTVVQRVVAALRRQSSVSRR